MTIRAALNHVTAYHYDRRVQLSPHLIRLRPTVHTRRPKEAYSLRIRPEKRFINCQQDPFENHLDRVVHQEPCNEPYIEVDIVANVTVIKPSDFSIEERANYYPFQYEAQPHRELNPYLQIVENGPHLRDCSAKLNRNQNASADFLVNFYQRLQVDTAHNIWLEPGVQSCKDTLQRAVGSCRDSAWIEVYITGAGWLGLDHTSGLFASERHISSARTHDAVSSVPLTGYTDDCHVELHHGNTVTRIHEDPRVTKLCRDDQWDTILALGERVDMDLAAQDVRLTMGGEPTFLSVDDMNSAEWNTAALGSAKSPLATGLQQRLSRRFARGPALHHLNMHEV